MDIKKQISPPSGEILSLISSLSNHTNHQAHTKALALKDTTLSASPISFAQTCVQFARVLACTSPDQIPQDEIQKWSQADGVSVMQLRHDPVGGWNQLREMSGLLLKNALVKSPIDANSKMRMRLLPDASQEIKQVLCQCIVDKNPGVRRVGSSIIASCTVGKQADGMEPLPLSEWGEGILAPFLINCLESAIGIMENANNNGAALTEAIKFALLGSLQTLTKVLEDDALKFERGSGAAFNKIVPCCLKLLGICAEERVKVDSLKCCVNMITCMPGSLIAQMNDFLGVLSSLAADNSSDVRKLVCQAIVTL